MERFDRHTRTLELLLLFLYCLTHLLPIGYAGLPLLSEPDTGQINETVVNGCVLGGKSYKLTEKWSLEMEEADMKYCVKCTCLPVNKVQKDQMYWTGKVSCHNIQRCPRPTCKKANESCCNSCPNLSSENKPFWKHKNTEFSALLVGSNLTERVSTTAVAIADISVRDTSLYYSIRLTRLKPATKILFVLENDNVIHQISIGHQQLKKTCRRRCSAMMQLCGVWRKLPILYHEYLREKQVSLVIATKEHPNGLVKGLIYPSNDRKKETLTAILVVKSMRGAGGRAYLTLNPIETSIDYSITILTDKKMEKTQEDATITIGQEKRPAFLKWVSDRELSITGTWPAPQKRSSRHLVRGRYSLIISTRTLGLISGKILPRMVCGTFQAVLSGGNPPFYKKYQTGIGSASFKLEQNGHINYRIGLSRLDSSLRQVTVERNLLSGSSGSRSNTWRRRKRNHGSLKKYYRPGDIGYGGWANCSYTKAKVTDLSRLFNGEMYVKASTEKQRRMALYGQIVEVPYHEQYDTFSGTPLVLVPPNPNPLKYAVKGYAWLIMGVGCQLHYQIMIQGRTITLSEPLNAYLTNTDAHINSPHTSENTSIMGNFYNNVVSGTLTAISQHLFRALDNGNATLRIISRKYPSGILEVKVSIPNNCWKISQDVNGIDSFLVGSNEKEDQQRSKCKFENRWYEEGETWVPNPQELCKTCSCVQGQVSCIDVLCPLLDCPNPVHIEGLCCPICSELEEKVRFSIEKNISCFFEADNRWHPAGTEWYPYLHPFGYSACAVCSCLEGKNEWDCKPRNCPPLACASAATKFNMTHCCPVCHDEAQSALSTDKALALVKPELLREGVCTFQNVTYSNGAKWYTNVILLGEPTCGICMCKDGKTKCSWKQCPRLKCKSIVRNQNSCCFRCLHGRSRTRKNGRKRF